VTSQWEHLPNRGQDRGIKGMGAGRVDDKELGPRLSLKSKDQDIRDKEHPSCSSSTTR